MVKLAAVRARTLSLGLVAHPPDKHPAVRLVVPAQQESGVCRVLPPGEQASRRRFRMPRAKVVVVAVVVGSRRSGPREGLCCTVGSNNSFCMARGVGPSKGSGRCSDKWQRCRPRNFVRGGGVLGSYRVLLRPQVGLRLGHCRQLRRRYSGAFGCLRPPLKNEISGSGRLGRPEDCRGGRCCRTAGEEEEGEEEGESAA